VLVATDSGQGTVARVPGDATLAIDRFAVTVDDDRKRIVIDVDGRRRVRIPLARLSARAWTFVASSGASALYAGMNESV